MLTLASLSALFAGALLAVTSRSTSARSRFSVNFSLDDLHFTNEEIEQDLFEQFERLDA